MLVGTFTRYQEAAIIATAGIILASIYVLWMYQRMMTGEPNEGTAKLPDLSLRETWVVAPVLAIIIGLGVYPKVLLDVINPAVERTMIQVGQHDPTPVVPLERGARQMNAATSPPPTSPPRSRRRRSSTARCSRC